MKNVFQKIKDSYFKSLKGEENFWIVLLGWGIGIYVLSVLSGFYLFKFPILFLNSDLMISNTLKYCTQIWLGMLGVMGIILIFIYPVVLVLAILKSLTKYSVVYFIFSLILILIFLFVHYGLSKTLLFPVSIAMIKSSKIGALSMVVISVYFLIKTLQFLSTKTPK